MLWGDKMKHDNILKIKRITILALFCALAYVCMLFVKIPVQFLTLDVKDSVITLCAMLFGPVYGIIISVLVPFVEMITISGTGPYGFVMNVLGSLAFSVVAGVIYKYKKTIYGAVTGLLSGAFAMIAVMLLANLFITPRYMGCTTADVVRLIPSLLLPFNVIKSVLNAAVVLLLYKPLSNILKRTGFIESASGETAVKNTNKTRSVIVTVSAVLVIAISLVAVFLLIRSF